MQIEHELKRYIEDEILDGSLQSPVEIQEQLIATGRLDSLGLVQLLDHIHRRWRVDLLSLAGPEDFTSVSTLARAIRRHATG